MFNKINSQFCTILLIILSVGVIVMVTFKGHFEPAIRNLLKREGGYVFDPVDPGGETNFGISKRSYPNINIKDLTQEQARAIYFRDFWITNELNKIENDEIATKILDIIVNVGSSQGFLIVSRAVRACGVKIEESAQMTPKLLLVINSFQGEKAANLIAAMRSELAGYYRLLARIKPPMTKFINGWLKRAYDE